MWECENASALIVEGGYGTNLHRWISIALQLQEVTRKIQKSSRFLENKSMAEFGAKIDRDARPHSPPKSYGPHAAHD